jgi:structure-specific recognition protein 1
VRCSLKANEGTLYPLAKSFVFINKPTLILKFEDVEHIEFKRYETTGATNLMRNFDLAVTLKSTGVKGETKEFSFNLIDRAEYKPLLDFLTSKKLTVKNPIVSYDLLISYCYSLLSKLSVVVYACMCAELLSSNQSLSSHLASFRP